MVPTEEEVRQKGPETRPIPLKNAAIERVSKITRPAIIQYIWTAGKELVLSAIALAEQIGAGLVSVFGPDNSGRTMGTPPRALRAGSRHEITAAHQPHSSQRASVFDGIFFLTFLLNFAQIYDHNPS